MSPHPACCSMGFYKWRKTDAFIYEIMTLYEHDILTGRIPDRPWYRDRYLSGIIIGAAALSGNSAYMLLVQEGDWNLKMNAVAIGSSAGTCRMPSSTCLALPGLTISC